MVANEQSFGKKGGQARFLTGNQDYILKKRACPPFSPVLGDVTALCNNGAEQDWVVQLSCFTGIVRAHKNDRTA